MAPVQPDGIFRRLAQVLGIGTVLHNAVMHVRTPRVVRCPPDDGQIVCGRLEFRPFGDLDALGVLRRGKYLSAGWVGRDQAADRSRDRQCHKQSIHWTDLRLLFPWKDDARAWGSRVTPMHPYLGSSALHPPYSVFATTEWAGWGQAGPPRLAVPPGGDGAVGGRKSTPGSPTKHS